MIRPASRKERTGFTLVELLVVIAIVAVLAGLLTAAVQVVRKRAIDTQNANDIMQMGAAMEAFKQQYKCYPPSRVRLLESGAYDMSQTNGQPNTPLDFESKNALTRIWPRLQFPIDWNNDGATTGDWTLEGDQCLVFFLGGIPSASPPGVTGFATSPTNPAAPVAQGGGRVQPFFAFSAARLVILSHNGVTSPFYSYADVHASVQTLSNVPTIPTINGKQAGQPFAYFATLKQPNQYNPYLSFPYAQNVSDCASIGAMPYFAPFLNNVAQYQNSATYQIISAGADQTFGSTVTNGGVIFNSSGNAGTFNLTNGSPPPQPFAGMDDRTNFSPNILAAGGNQ